VVLLLSDWAETMVTRRVAKRARAFIVVDVQSKMVRVKGWIESWTVLGSDRGL